MASGQGTPPRRARALGRQVSGTRACLLKGLRSWEMWTPVDRKRMLRAWAMAEVTNPRWAHNLAGVGWPSELQAKMKADDWAALTEAEWESVEDVIAQLRASLLDGLLQLQPRWYEGELAIEAVAQMRIMAYPPFVANAPSRRLVDLAEVERGASSGPPEFLRAYMVGTPIAVAPVVGGPFTLVEGYTRCCRALRDWNSARFDGLPIPMLIGVTERIGEWSWM
jgi:hypothetical protein